MTGGELEQLREGVKEYCASFYTGVPGDDRNYALKAEHTFLVAENARVIAETEGLDPGEVRLAEGVGLCHDLGRFPQYREYRTFRDADSVNHAVLSARVAEREILPEGLDAGERRTLLHAVARHNVFSLDAGTDPKALRHARIIRDADKLDIWRVFMDEFSVAEDERASAATLGFPDVGECSPEALAGVRERRMLRLETVRTLDDFRLLQLSWVFDLNFHVSLRLFRERGILPGFAALLPRNPAVTAALQSLSDWLDARIAPA